ncbi:MoxR family ATPase [Candidatus Poribacteria bacterium]|nr:MoxR family ATPase [Candidatus Poribacteria bacterium]
MALDLAEIRNEVAERSAFVERLEAEVAKLVVGQRHVVDRLLAALLCNGHVLLEGLPGLAKTLVCKTLSAAIQAKFQRIQFTPDLLPADLIGTLIYNVKEQTFEPRKGPLFANFILADEINRAPAKVQSALLEAMQERQITIGDTTYPLDDPFIVLATQNPIEQEGTYPLPEAQIDRFLFKVKVGYPTRDEEREILENMAIADSTRRQSAKDVRIQPVVDPKEIRAARAIVDSVYMDEKVKRYILDLVSATRTPEAMGLRFHSARGKAMVNLEKVIQVGASPRATIALAIASKAHAFLRHRAHVTPDDVKAIGMDVLRHRILITYEAEAEELTSDDIVRQIFDQVQVP